MSETTSAALQWTGIITAAEAATMLRAAGDARVLIMKRLDGEPSTPDVSEVAT